MTYDIKREREHFVVYIDNRFFCSADDEKEAAKEIEKYAKERGALHETQNC